MQRAAWDTAVLRCATAVGMLAAVACGLEKAIAPMVIHSCVRTRSAMSGTSSRLLGIRVPLVESLSSPPLVWFVVAAGVGAHSFLGHIVLPMHGYKYRLVLCGASLGFLSTATLHVHAMLLLPELCVHEFATMSHASGSGRGSAVWP